jgi:glycosyltransferase involved in cell wall biosynthesis
MGITQSEYDPASRFRFIQFIPYLKKAGWEVRHRPNLPDRQWKSPLRSRMARALHYRAARLLMKASRCKDVLESRKCDVVFVNRDFAAEGPILHKFFRSVARRCIFDFDDAIFVGPNEKMVRWMCANARWVTPGNEFLADYARQHTERVTVIPTVIDTESYIPRLYSNFERPQMVRVGWSGSDQSIQATLVPYLGLLAKLQSRLDFELVVITNTKPQLPVTDLRWSFVPWSQNQEPFLGSKFDIGIMPLLDDEFLKGKCGLKLLQYMAAALPTVASPVGVNRSIVRHGVTGMLAAKEEEWHRALELLIRDARVRARMGRAGRQICEQEYSVNRWLPVLISIFNATRQQEILNAEEAEQFSRSTVPS